MKKLLTLFLLLSPLFIRAASPSFEQVTNQLQAPLVKTNDTRRLNLANANNSFVGVFTGNGANITNIPQSGVTSLGADLSGKTGTNETRTVTFSSSGNSFAGIGSGLTQLTPENLVSGTATIDISGNAATADFVATADSALRLIGGNLSTDYLNSVGDDDEMIRILATDGTSTIGSIARTNGVFTWLGEFVIGSDGALSFGDSSAWSVDVVSGTNSLRVFSADYGANVIVFKSNGITSMVQFEGDWVGKTNGETGGSGTVGEIQQVSRSLGSPVTLTSGAVSNIASVALTAGEWDVTGVVYYTLTGATVTDIQLGISDTSGTMGPQGQYLRKPFTFTLLSSTYSDAVPVFRLAPTETTTIYLVAQTTFSAGSIAAYGNLRARRVR